MNSEADIMFIMEFLCEWEEVRSKDRGGEEGRGEVALLFFPFVF